MAFMKDSEIIARYEGAKEIYLLTRTKVLSVKENLLDWGVAILTPLPGIVDEADKIADMGTYLFVVKEREELLVRVEGSKIEEENITGKYKWNKSENKFIYNGNKFVKGKNLLA